MSQYIPMCKDLTFNGQWDRNVYRYHTFPLKKNEISCIKTSIGKNKNCIPYSFLKYIPYKDRKQKYFEMFATGMITEQIY